MDAAAEARKHRHVASLRTRLVIEDTLVDNQRATALARYVVDLCAAMRDPTRGWYRDANQLEKVFEMESPEPTTKNVGRRVLEIITDWKLFNEALALHSVRRFRCLRARC
jgi:hypothetical protein